MVRFCFILFFISGAGFAKGQNAKFTATSNSTQVSVGEQFEVTFSDNGSGEGFEPPSFRGFQVVFGPSVSSSMTVINGAMSASNAYSYYLVAQKTGVLNIEPASIYVNGKLIRSNALRISVVKGNRVAPANSASSTDSRTQLLQAGSSAKSIFIRADVTKTNVFQGEQLVVSYKLYTRVDIVGNELSKLPELNGFWNQDLKNPNQNTIWTTEIYKGAEYNVTPLKQTILFPEHAGNLLIDPLAMTFVIRQPVKSEDIFDEFFGSFEEVKVQLKSKPITIRVKPLPESGKPTTFSGAVGKFSMDATLDKQALKANESLNYQLKISGAGNLKLLDRLAIDFPKGFEKYDPKITDSLSESLDGMAGKRIYSYVLIPRQEGDFELINIRFSYFDPVSAKYVSLTAPAFKVKVSKGDRVANVGSLPADEEGAADLIKDIRYIKTGKPAFCKNGEGFFGSTLYFLLLAVGPILFISALGYRKWDRKNNSDLVKVKGKNAGKVAAKHLANAQTQLAINNSKAFYEAVFKGLYGYLSDKLNIPAADLNRENISQELKVRLVSNPSVVELIETLDLCEMARYAPVAAVSETEMMTRAKNCINNIETQLQDV